MSIRVALHHRTAYRYDQPVTLSPQTVRLRPAAHARQTIGSYSLTVEPKDHFINWQQDPQGNFLARLTFPRPTQVFTVTVDLTAEMTVINPFDFFLEPYAEQYPFAYQELQARELAPFLAASPPGPRLQEWLAAVDRRQTATLAFLVNLNQGVGHIIEYATRMEPGIQTPEETLVTRRGSCRDSAWLLVEILRHLGLAARFVSGYLIQLKPDSTPLEGPTGPSADSTDLHAWAEVFLPGAGWIGLDPTSGLLTGEGHIPLAAASHPDSAAPVSGSVSPSGVEFEHEMYVTRIHEDPRVAHPYTEPQWESIELLGEQVERDLAAGDTRLTLGGEPTFVSLDDRDSAEWNTTALGPAKQGLAAGLLRRLRDRFAPGGLLHFGRELPPSWTMACYWRTDGVPLWEDLQWCADLETGYGFGPPQAESFGTALAARLPGVAVPTLALRDGRLYVRMPQVGSLDAYTALTSAIEVVAAQLRIPVLLEGCFPPSDPRLQQIGMVPRPGVLAVIPPAAGSWRELVQQASVLFEEAGRSRLTSEKFLLDGRHTGTGGGNPLLLGGATIEDSPFLRRPDLLRSLLGFWLNHPALSYLFAGAVVGPDGPAPRIDETRPDAVYELEIAFSLLTSGAGARADHIFRNLLVNSAGSTRRVEFCIERPGLLELRAFEMAPHPRMMLLQQLLVRALVARFWQEPYREPLIRWGSRLHDRFLLPYYIEQDLQRVLGELGHSGYEFSSAWFAPHLEFRFPLAGRVCYEGVELELRHTIEPWPLLGVVPVEGGGTTRYVDSSVERLQVHVRGLTPERQAVTCNSRLLPLQPTGVDGEFVCGVRYRAWQPLHSLHPTLPVHTPLVFDLVDLSLERSLGGCTYYAAHPGGRNYDTFAVNSNEAEARRRARFLKHGHTPGTMLISQAGQSTEYPATLDLRWLGGSGRY